MKIILYQPQIPQNTGNIVRTCAATGSDLTLVHPLGFSTSAKMLRRAGLDYWEGVQVDEIDDLESYLEQTTAPFYFVSSKVPRSFTEVEYSPDSNFIFGSETTGLPDHFFQRWPERFVTIPMVPNVRCLNLSNAAAIVIYEAWRQQQFQQAAVRGESELGQESHAGSLAKQPLSPA